MQKSPARVFDRGAHGGAFAFVHGFAEQPDAGILGGQAVQNGGGAVGGTIVDDHQLPLHVFGKRRGQHLRQAPLDDSALVVNRDQNRE